MTLRLFRSIIPFAFLGAALSAHASVIDFEDVPGSSVNDATLLPNGYAGYNWDGLEVLGRSYIEGYGPLIYGPPDGYLHAMSGNFAAYNVEGSYATITAAAGTPLIRTFNASFDSLGEFPGQMYVTGYHNGEDVGHYVLSANEFHYMAFNDADTITFVSIITLHPGYYSSPRRFGIDNVAINMAGPSPAALLPFAAGTLARLRKRKKKA